MAQTHVAQDLAISVLASGRDEERALCGPDRRLISLVSRGWNQVIRHSGCARARVHPHMRMRSGPFRGCAEVEVRCKRGDDGAQGLPLPEQEQQHGSWSFCSLGEAQLDAASVRTLVVSGCAAASYRPLISAVDADAAVFFVSLHGLRALDLTYMPPELLNALPHLSRLSDLTIRLGSGQAVKPMPGPARVGNLEALRFTVDCPVAYLSQDLDALTQLASAPAFCELLAGSAGTLRTLRVAPAAHLLDGYSGAPLSRLEELELGSCTSSWDMGRLGALPELRSVEADFPLACRQDPTSGLIALLARRAALDARCKALRLASVVGPGALRWLKPAALASIGRVWFRVTRLRACVVDLGPVSLFQLLSICGHADLTFGRLSYGQQNNPMAAALQNTMASQMLATMLPRATLSSAADLTGGDNNRLSDLLRRAPECAPRRCCMFSHAEGGDPRVSCMLGHASGRLVLEQDILYGEVPHPAMAQQEEALLEVPAASALQPSALLLAMPLLRKLHLTVPRTFGLAAALTGLPLQDVRLVLTPAPAGQPPQPLTLPFNPATLRTLGVLCGGGREQMPAPDGQWCIDQLRPLTALRHLTVHGPVFQTGNPGVLAACLATSLRSLRVSCENVRVLRGLAGAERPHLSVVRAAAGGGANPLQQLATAAEYAAVALVLPGLLQAGGGLLQAAGALQRLASAFVPHRAGAGLSPALCQIVMGLLRDSKARSYQEACRSLLSQALVHSLARILPQPCVLEVERGALTPEIRKRLTEALAAAMPLVSVHAVP